MEKRKSKIEEGVLKKQKKLDEQKFLIQFLEKYRTLTALWDTESNDYTNKILKEKQNEELLAKYQEFYETATMKEMKARLNTLRTNYRTERKKMNESRKSDTGRDASGDDSDDGNRRKIYISSKWYFEVLDSFLHTIEKPATHRSTMSSGVVARSTREELPDNEDNHSPVQDSVSIVENENTQLVSDDADGLPFTPSSQRKKEKKIETNLLQLACKHLSTVAESKRESTIDGVKQLREDLRQSMEGDEYCMARGWANDVKRMSSDQAIWAKKFIRDIIAEGQLGMLHRNAVYINPPVIDPQIIESVCNN